MSTDAADVAHGERMRQESMFAAARLLEEAVAVPRGEASWYGGVRAALRACTVAVEARLDNVTGAGGQALRTQEPRLLPALERLEAALAQLLVEFWAAKGDVHELAYDHDARLSQLVEAMRAVAGDEFALVHEVFNEPGQH